MSIWDSLITAALPSVISQVGGYFTEEDQRDYDQEAIQEEREYKDKVRAEGYAREDKAQALALQLEAIKAKYQQNPALLKMMLSPGEALSAIGQSDDRKQDAIKTLIAAMQNPLLSRA